MESVVSILKKECQMNWEESDQSEDKQQIGNYVCEP